jgi:hypothetical protein
MTDTPKMRAISPHIKLKHYLITVQVFTNKSAFSMLVSYSDPIFINLQEVTRQVASSFGKLPDLTGMEFKAMSILFFKEISEAELKRFFHTSPIIQDNIPIAQA